MITKVPWHISEGIFIWRLQSVKQDRKLHVSRDQWVNEEPWRIRVIELGHYFSFGFGFDSLSIARLGTNFSDIWNKTQTFSVKEMHLTKLYSQNKSHTSPCGGRSMGRLFWVPWRNGTARYRECAVIRLHYGLCNFQAHFSDVILGGWRLKVPVSRLFSQSFVQAQIKENTKAPRHWPLRGEFTGDRWIPLTKGQ